MIDVLGPFAPPRELRKPLVTLSRYQMQFLDTFHNSQPVWIFATGDSEPQSPLFLSTKVEVFANIRGPLWRAGDAEGPHSCSQYAVGNGRIYKWKPHGATPQLFQNEVLCHWIPDSTSKFPEDDDNDTEELEFANRIHEAFDGSEVLLVGAVAAGCERLTSNRSCGLNLGEERTRFCDSGRVRMLGTIKEHSYRDSKTYQLQVGHSGINAGKSMQYKRRSQSMKQALIELWTTIPHNHLNIPSGVRKKHAYYHNAEDGWHSHRSVRNMAETSDIWLGSRGTLRLLSHLQNGTLLMTCRASRITTVVKRLTDVESPHQRRV